MDVVIEGSCGNWVVEIKTGDFSERDLAGLFEFNRRFPAYRPLVISGESGLRTANRAGADATTWVRFLGDDWLGKSNREVLP